MNYLLPDIRKADVKGKTIFLRADLDVPLKELRIKNPIRQAQGRQESWEVDDDSRLKASLATIHYLQQQKVKIIIAGHLGRPGEKMDPALSLYPVGQWFSQFIIPNSSFMIQKTRIGEFDGWKLGDNLFLLENLRFYPGEEANDLEFARKLASLADVYVNDAFSVSHRDHASMTGVAKLLPHYAGIHLQLEVSSLSQVLETTRRPLVVIIGGKKLETKLPLVEKMLDIADYILVGGLIAKEIEEHHPIYSAKLKLGRQNEDATDIQAVSIDEFLRIIKTAKTIIWNGSMGKIGTKDKVLETEEGTRRIAEGIIASGAYTVVGGGDSIEYLEKIHVLDKFSFVSMSGGAMLAFLAGEKLPGIEALVV